MSKSPLVILSAQLDNLYSIQIEDQISDINLLNEYMATKSVKTEIESLRSLLVDEDIPAEKVNRIIAKRILALIPPGTKGAVRGKKFNLIVQKHIQKIEWLKAKGFEVAFEKNHPKVKTSEIPDWYVWHRESGKVVIGMNQLDLWSGGAQTNRADKYIMQEELHADKDVRWLAVVCRRPTITGENKVFKIVKTGIEKKRMCYVPQIEDILREHFPETLA